MRGRRVSKERPCGPTALIQAVEENSLETLRTWFDMMDLDGSGVVSRDEHMRWSLNAATMASGAGIEKVFQRYDRDGSGELSELEFARACRDMGLGDHAEAQALYKRKPGILSARMRKWHHLLILSRRRQLICY